MRHFATLSLMLFVFLSVHGQITETATDAVKNMGVGWNLGNTLDANSGSGTDFTSASYWGGQGVESETCWGQPKTKKDLLSMMKKAGFGAIRVPVTWYNHMDKDGKVNAAWMKRVHDVVDYVIDNGMYCIINVHHDTGASSSTFAHWIQAEGTNYTSNKSKFENLWTQISEEFKSYGNKLLFEGYNEMLDGQSTWNAPKNTSSYDAINNYAQSFVNAVRATGGNNATRNLIVNTYAAANGDAAVKNLKIPTDNASNHIIAEVHAYPNFYTWSTPATLRTITQVKGDVDYIANTLKTQFVSKGTPVIIGEWGSYGVDNGAGKTDYDVNKAMFLSFCDYFVKKMKENNIATFYWMGLSDGQYRSIPAFSQADLAEKIAKAYHGSTFNGLYPVPDKTSSVVAFEGEKVLGWGNGFTIANSSFSMVGSTVQLTLTYKQTSDDNPDIQFFFGDWSAKVPFTAGGVVYEGDFNPKAVYSSSTGTEHTTTFTFDAATFTTLASKGMVVHGDGITVYKAELSAPTGLNPVAVDVRAIDAPIYNLAGQKVSKTYRGLYIKGGKKYLVK